MYIKKEKKKNSGELVRYIFIKYFFFITNYNNNNNNSFVYAL